jgi:hypothetical protein
MGPPVSGAQGGYYGELEAVRSGTARTVPADEAIPGWQERLAAATGHWRMQAHPG